MPVCLKTFRDNIGNYQNKSDKYLINEKYQQELINSLARYPGDGVKRARAELMLQSLLFLSNMPFSLPPNRLSANGTAAGQDEIAQVRPPPLLSGLLGTHNTAPGRINTPPIPPASVLAAREVKTSLPGGGQGRDSGISPFIQRRRRELRAENRATTPSETLVMADGLAVGPAESTSSLMLEQEEDTRQRRHWWSRQTHRLGQFLVRQNITLPGDANNAAAVINDTIKYIVAESAGLANISRELLKHSGLYGEQKDEDIGMDVQFSIFNEWLERVIFNGTVGEFASQVINQAVSDNGCHSGKPLQMPCDFLKTAIEERLQKIEIGHRPERKNTLRLTPLAIDYIMHEVVLAAFPELGLPRDRMAESPPYLGTVRWAFLHVALVFNAQAGIESGKLSLEELIQLGGSLENMLREGAVDVQLMGLFELPAILCHARMLAEQGSDVVPGEPFHDEKGKESALAAFFTASDAIKMQTNPFWQLAEALRNYRTRAQLSHTAEASVPPDGEGGDTMPPGEKRYCAGTEAGRDSGAIDAGRLFSEQNEGIAARYQTVDGLLLDRAFEQIGGNETVFLREARIYWASAEFSAIDTIRTQPAFRVIPRHAYTVSLAPGVDLFAALHPDDKRIYALQYAEDRYLLTRVDYHEGSYYSLMSDGARCYRDKDLKLKVYGDTPHGELLKSVGGSVEQLKARIIEKHRRVFLNQLHELGYGETTAEKTQKFLLSLIPFYDCINGLVRHDAIAPVYCALAIPQLLPAAGQGLSIAAKMSQRGLRGGLLAYRSAHRAAMAGKTLGSMLRQGSGQLLHRAIVPSAEVLDKKTLVQLGLAALRTFDPGLELMSALVGGSVRQAMLVARTAEYHIPVWKKLLPDLDNVLARDGGQRLTNDITSGRLAGYHRDVPVVKLGGDKFENNPIYVRVDPATGQAFGKKYTRSPEGILHRVPEPMAVRLKNILEQGLSGRGGAGIGRRRGRPARPAAQLQDSLTDTTHHLLRWLDNSSKPNPVSRGDFLKTLNVSETVWLRFVSPSGALTAEAVSLLMRAGVYEWNRLFELSSELQENIIDYLDVYSLRNFLLAFPSLGAGHPRLISLRILAENRLGTLQRQYYDAFQRWLGLGHPMEKRWLAVEKLYGYFTQGGHYLSLAGLRLRTLPAILPAEIRHLDVSVNRLSSLPVLPAGLKKLEVQINNLAELSGLPDGLSILNADFNGLTRLPHRFPSSLTYLDVARNRLTALPALPLTVVFLDVSGNFITVLPDNLGDSIITLKVNQNLLAALPSLPRGLRHLEARRNALTSLPGDLPMGLHHMDVAVNRLSSLPAILPAELNFLDVSGNQLTRLPAILSPGLSVLRAQDNLLASLPLMLPPKLKHLSVANNALIFMPAYLPTGLLTVNVQNNLLVSLPWSMGLKLKKLRASNNFLIALPGNLPDSLEVMRLDHNPFDRLPDRLPASLRVLNVRNTGVRTRPADLAASVALSMDN